MRSEDSSLEAEGVKEVSARERRLLERMFHIRRVLLRPKVDKECQTDSTNLKLLLEAGVSPEVISIMGLHDDTAIK
jgi:hypothetical protein